MNMVFAEWLLSVLSSSAAVLFVMWLMKSLISTRLKANVEHEFNEKIEAVRSEIRKNEESFKADLKAKENQIAALRDGVLSAATSRQIAFDKRRMEAIDQLWLAMGEAGKYRHALAYMDRVNFKEAAQASAKEAIVRTVFSTLVQNVDQYSNSTHLREAQKARPYITPIAWALYKAYEALIVSAIVKVKTLQTGVNLPNIIDDATVIKMLKLALPDFSDLIDKATEFYVFLEALEEMLLREFRQMMTGGESDRESVCRYAEIIKAADTLMAKTADVQQ